MSQQFPPWSPTPIGPYRGHRDAQVLTDRAAVEECRDILGCRPEPSWWAVAREYMDERPRSLLGD